ncbi:hypothetical protein BD289DRAFT_363365 [Coniella lustricola]|uniref:Uncharacterized protein n=1 Tax=Coniella lustricola TaxID=2025994 RepID=A0A2T3AFF9_9PEZI|nr:hypothetical protein BD289DRAFT_363365 [Coniella lustricola]
MPNGRQPKFSTAAESAAAMLHRLREEHNVVRTVKLPKGHASSTSPAVRAGGHGIGLSTPGSASSDNISPIASQISHSHNQTRQFPPELHELQGFSVLDLLEADERPSFIIDVSNTANFHQDAPLQLVFANASLRASEGVFELISQTPGSNSEFSRFKAWILSFIKDSQSMDVSLPSLSYGGISWTCSTLANRFRFVSGNASAVSITPTSPIPPARASSVAEQRARCVIPPAARKVAVVTPDRALSDADYFGDADPHDVDIAAARRAQSEPKDFAGELRPDTPEIHTNEENLPPPSPGSELTQTFDWTRIDDISVLSPHLQFARSIRWEETPLGPIEHWPGELRTMSNMVMGSPHPAAMYWGPEHIAIYNEAYLPMAGNKHPKLMGQSYIEAWAEIWDELKPVFDSAWYSGQATMKHDDRLFISRNGFLEETFFNWSVVPLVGSSGNVVALYNPAFENTRRKVNERRMFTLREVGEMTALARDVQQFWKQVHRGLEYNEFDIPFALIYSVVEDPDSDMSSMHSGSATNPPKIQLAGSLGVPAGHFYSEMSTIDLRTSADGFAPYLRVSMTLPSAPIILSKQEGTLPQHLIEGIQWRGFGDPSRTVVVFPVHPTTGDGVVGFVVVGVNPRRPYNDDYRLFINLLSRQLATSMASVVLFEEEIKRGQQAARMAALDRQQLSQELRLRTQEAVESEYKFSRMAEFAPVGIFITNAQGDINFCNDSWWEISRHPRTTDSFVSWMDSILPQDRLAVEAAWDRLINDKVSITQEFRFKAPREVNGHTIETWALMSAYPEKNDAGDTKAIFGCITDISQQKWAEAFQKQRREEALELKRQQENFIDMTSHEMRNPLSALCQCADEIVGSILAYRKMESDTNISERLQSTLDVCLEAANTISLCANHQKKIINDVLTLSRLDSRMLEVTPTLVKPVEVIETSLKMFDAELVSNNIKSEFRIDQSYYSMGIQQALLDPARLQQVLINLLTNAIKFTQKQEQRSIIVTLGASTDVSKAQVAGIEFFPVNVEEEEEEDFDEVEKPEKKEEVDITDGDQWGGGDKFNLHLSVSDTGPGLTNEERAMLFQRFRQTSPRTHVEYGGSGLGLFISRMLTELQGGQIGVISEKGAGSTFAFYIKSRKSVEVPPQAPPPSLMLTGTALATQSVLRQDNDRSGSQTAGAGLHMVPELDPSTVDVLVVEDNEVNQKVLGRLLRRFGFKAHLANHGGEAIAKLQKSRHWNHQAAASEGIEPVEMEDDEEIINVSIVLMDLEMPIMDGMTCARRIRELESQGVITARLPIIAVTAYVRPEQIGQARASGMDDIVSKPFRAPELTPKITNLLLNPPTGETPMTASPMSLASPDSDQPSAFPFSST